MSYAERVKRDGPLVFWRLEETSGTTATDASDNNNDGTWSAEPTWGVSGAIDSAVEVASGQYIQLSAGPDPVTDWTIEAWINVKGSWPSTRATIASVADASASGEYLDLAVESGNLVHSRGAATSGDSISVDLSSYDASLWHHVVLRQTRLDSTTVEVGLWLDGEQVGGASGDWADASPPWEFGGVGGGGSPWNRELDELAVFDYFVDAQQIRRHYWNVKGFTDYVLEVLASGAISFWKLDDQSGTSTASDVTGSHDGTYDGTTLEAGALVRTSDFSADVSTGGVTTNWAFSPSSFSLEAWINSTSVSSKGYVYTDRTKAGWIYILRTSGGALEFFTSGNNGEVSATASISDNTTYHVVATYDGSNARLYINGDLKDSVSQSGLNSSDRNLTIGELTSGGDALQGRVDYPAVYGRALTDEEVRRHYELGLNQNSYRIEVLSSLPSSYHKLDDAAGSTTAADKTGNYPGSYDGPTLESSPALNIGGFSAEFDGTDDRVDAGWPGPQSAPFTLSCWFKPHTNPGSWQTLIDGPETGNSDSFALRYKNDRVELGGRGVSSNTGGGPVTSGEWYFVVVTYDGTNVNVYLDSTLVASNSTSVGFNTNNLYIGGRPNGDRPFDGLIDEVAVYEEVLSEQEIIRQYYVGKLGPVIGLIRFISGVVTDESDGSALDATVRAYRWSDGKLLQSTTSDPSTGEYRIEGVENSELLVVMQPPSGLRPLAHGPLKPAEETA